MRRIFEKTIRSELYPEQVGDFELITLELLGPKLKKEGSFKRIALDLIYENFSIFEDINSNCLSGTLTVVDSNYLITDFPIIGEESVRVAFRSLDTKIGVDLKFRVTKLEHVEKLTAATSVYTLHLISEVSIRSEKQKISKSFPKGKLSDVVSWICENKLHLKREDSIEYVERGDYYVKEKSIEDHYYSIETNSAHIEKYTVPNHSPFRTINKLCKRNVSNSGSLFFFFQDINRFRFVSLEDIFKRRNRDNFIKKLVYIPADSQPEKLSHRDNIWNIVYNYKIVKRFNVFENMSRGMYSSSVDFFDIEKRKFETNSYYYQTDAQNSYHVNNDGFLLTTENSDVVHNPGNEDAATVRYLVPFHTGDKESQDYSDQRKEMFQRRMSMQAQINALILQIEMSGDSSGRINIGDLIHFHVPREQRIEGDLYLSGNYLVTRIHHMINNTEKYRMIIEMVTDTLPVGYKTDIDNNLNNAKDNISTGVDPKDMMLGKDQDIVHTSVFSSEINDNYNSKTRERSLLHKIFSPKV